MKSKSPYSIRIFAALFLGLCLWAGLHEPATPNRISEARNNTVLVESGRGSGSGILVSRINPAGHYVTYVWTVAHVVIRPDTVTASTNDVGVVSLVVAPVVVRTAYGRSEVAEVISYSSRDDIALLRVLREDWTTNSVCFYRGAPPTVGTPVFHVGNFYGLRMQDSYTQGFVSHVNRLFVYDQLQLSVYPGSSGGGVFLSANGECIGLVDARCEETIALVIPVRTLEQWAWLHGVQAALP